MQTIIKKVLKIVEEYKMIEENDVIAVGLSGGKDSLILLKSLSILKKFYSKHFSLIAISIDMRIPEMNFESLKEFCKELDVSYHIIPTDIYDIVFNIRKEKNPCSLCAKLRRGILCSTAKSLGANKLALGHHSDDLAETLFLCMLKEGRLSTIQPVTFLSNSNINMIRPLLYVHEDEIIKVVNKYNLPVLKSKCPADKHTEREKVKELINKLDKNFPDSKKNIINSITHTERYNLLKK